MCRFFWYFWYSHKAKINLVRDETYLEEIYVRIIPNIFILHKGDANNNFFTILGERLKVKQNSTVLIVRKCAFNV